MKVTFQDNKTCAIVTDRVDDMLQSGQCECNGNQSLVWSKLKQAHTTPGKLAEVNFTFHIFDITAEFLVNS